MKQTRNNPLPSVVAFRVDHQFDPAIWAHSADLLLAMSRSIAGHGHCEQLSSRQTKPYQFVKHSQRLSRGKLMIGCARRT